MPRTTDKAERILEYVNQFVQENGYAPSVREIGAAVGLKSTATVSYHIQALQAKGLLLSPGAKGRKRAIATGIRPGQIPVVGVVTAGVPILAVENQEGTLPDGFVLSDGGVAGVVSKDGEKLLSLGAQGSKLNIPLHSRGSGANVGVLSFNAKLSEASAVGSKYSFNFS